MKASWSSCTLCCVLCYCVCLSVTAISEDGPRLAKDIPGTMPVDSDNPYPGGDAVYSGLREYQIWKRMPKNIELTKEEGRLWRAITQSGDEELMLLVDFLEYGYDGHSKWNDPKPGEPGYDPDYALDWTRIEEPKNLKLQSRPIFWSLVRKRIIQVAVEREVDEERDKKHRADESEFFTNSKPRFAWKWPTKTIDAWLKDKPPMILHPVAESRKNDKR